MSSHPSTDLYFRNACGDLVGRWWRRGPVRRAGANSFVCGDWRMLIRNDSAAAVDAALGWPGRLAYVVDDDVNAAAQCAALPADYRARMAAFAGGDHGRLLGRADVILAASDALAAAMHEEAPGKDVRRVDPAWVAQSARLDHFEPLAAGGALQIVHLGSGTHAAALAAITPAVLSMLAAHPLARFTYFSGQPIDAALEGHARARRLQPKPWPEYRGWLVRQRFHLALYPLLDTRFDRARSANKIAEHAIVGAAGLYPAGWGPAQAMAGGALLAPDDPVAWADALHGAATQGPELRRAAAMAAVNEELAGARVRQRKMWLNLLGLAGG